MSQTTDRQLRRKIRQWAEANEPKRAVECAVKIHEFLRTESAFNRKSWLLAGFSAMWERIKQNEQ